MSNKKFRSTLNELLDSLYMHVHTMADIENAVEKKDLEEFGLRVEKSTMSTFSMNPVI